MFLSEKFSNIIDGSLIQSVKTYLKLSIYKIKNKPYPLLFLFQSDQPDSKFDTSWIQTLEKNLTQLKDELDSEKLYAEIELNESTPSDNEDLANVVDDFGFPKNYQAKLKHHVKKVNPLNFSQTAAKNLTIQTSEKFSGLVQILAKILEETEAAKKMSAGFPQLGSPTTVTIQSDLNQKSILKGKNFADNQNDSSEDESVENEESSSEEEIEILKSQIETWKTRANRERDLKNDLLEKVSKIEEENQKLTEKYHKFVETVTAEMDAISGVNLKLQDKSKAQNEKLAEFNRELEDLNKLMEQNEVLRENEKILIQELSAKEQELKSVTVLRSNNSSLTTVESLPMENSGPFIENEFGLPMMEDETLVEQRESKEKSLDIDGYWSDEIEEIRAASHASGTKPDPWSLDANDTAVKIEKLQSEIQGLNRRLIDKDILANKKQKEIESKIQSYVQQVGSLENQKQSLVAEIKKMQENFECERIQLTWVLKTIFESVFHRVRR